MFLSPDSSSTAPLTASVLVVDDAEDNLLLTGSLLERPGLEVLLASSAERALELLQQREVALVLLDVHMPRVSGFELAEQMRRMERLRHVPIIFITGHGVTESHTFLGYEAGAVDFLIKPVDARVLESKVRIFVELYLQRRELCERNAELQDLLACNEALAAQLRQAHTEAVEEAHTDALTGVANRRRILQCGEAALIDRRRQSQPLSVAVLDLDHFKAINDLRGHDFGDAVLRAFCVHVNRRIRSPHILGRLGGEEFLMLMPGTSLVEAEVVLQRLHETLELHDGVRYTFSAGVAQVSDGEALHAVVKRADTALYAAKRTGRNCSVTSPAPLPVPGERG